MLAGNKNQIAKGGGMNTDNIEEWIKAEIEKEWPKMSNQEKESLLAEGMIWAASLKFMDDMCKEGE